MQKQLQIKFIFFFPLLLFIANIISKSLFLTAQNISIDEPFSIYEAQFGYGAIIEHLSHYNNPPLFELLLHGWIKLFGISSFSVRIFPMIFACLCPVALYYFGRTHFSLRVGIVGSLLLTASTLLLFYAHDCRVYSLFLLLCILSMHYFLKLLRKENPWFISGLFVLFNVLLMYAHYFGIFIIFFQGIFLLLYHRAKLLKILTCYAVVALFYLPHIIVLWTRFNDSVQRGTWVQPPQGLQSLYNMLWAFSNEPLVTVVCIVVLFAAILNALIKKRFEPPNETHLLIFIWFLFSFVGLFLTSYLMPMYISRYLIFVLPAYYILLVIAINSLFQRPVLRNIISACLVGLFFFSADFNPDKKHDGAPAIELIKLIKDPETMVIGIPKDYLPAFCYHYSKEYFSSVKNDIENLTDSLLKNDNVFMVNNIDDLNAIARDRYKKIIFFSAGNCIQKNEMMAYLRNHYKFIGHKACKDSYDLDFFGIH